MNLLARIAYRIYQKLLFIISAFLPWRSPEIIKGGESGGEVITYLKEHRISSVMLVTDRVISGLGLNKKLIRALMAADFTVTIYEDTVPDPSVDEVEAVVELYKSSQSEALIAFGGGSVIDCAKAASARLSRPGKRLERMAGLLHVLRRKVPLIAVPTTAGTGSEATITAVITDKVGHRKYTINDLALIPDVAVFQPELLTGLPPAVTAATGMDALCHAVEAYIGRSNTVLTRKEGREAVQLIFSNLYASFADGENISRRYNMLIASFKAGKAFTRAYVGYVHAVAHTLGGRYHIPHGLANAALLPVVLRQYGTAIHKQLAELSDCLPLTDSRASDAEKAEAFISAIEALNSAMNMPGVFYEIRDEDVPEMIHDAIREANPFYPVPEIWGKEQLNHIYQSVSPGR